MYLILSRHNSNVGDYLILERAKNLVETLKPDTPSLVGHIAIPLYDQITPAQFKQLKAVIITGGPGIRPNIYPDIYPVHPDILTHNIPIIFLGIGAKYYPGEYSLAHMVKLSQQSLQFLHHIEDTGFGIGVRDIHSVRVLNLNGIQNVSLNGCPAWYAVNEFPTHHVQPKEIRRILFTTPATPFHYRLAASILKALRTKFPEATILVSFHHGIQLGEKGDPRLTDLNVRLLNYAKKLGCETFDASYDLKKIQVYDTMDIHVGFRVHAHIYFLSYAKPSFLIAEDSRGDGVVKTLGGVGFPAWNKLGAWTGINWITRLGFSRAAEGVERVTKLNMQVNYHIPTQVVEAITSEVETKFQSFQPIPKRLEYWFKHSMKKFIDKIP
ncbi:MAG: polysaccharide pyruvyl transferase family protein [Candidatus Odinarchaeota archaeon]